MGRGSGRRAIWIDFENAPHVWIFSLLAQRLRRAGYPLILTARDFSCTVGLCRQLGFDAQVVGRPGMGRSRRSKTLRLGERAASLYLRLFPRRSQVALAVSHGSRSQMAAAHYLGIPVLVLDDYEYTDKWVLRFAQHHLMPFPIPKEVYGRYADRTVWYPGLKEDLYLCDFQPGPTRPAELGDDSRVRVLLRPEGRFTHYRSTQSEVLQGAILDYLAQHEEVLLVLLPRDEGQGRDLDAYCRAHGIEHWTPGEVLDGPALIWEMDLVIGGGGTMTREAARLEVPAYSFFAGRWGGVDRYLQAQQRLVRLAEVDDVQQIRLEKRVRTPPAVSHEALDFVTDFVRDLVG